VPLSNNPAFDPIKRQVLARLRQLGIMSRVDDSSASIGKRYARNDELGTPLGITVDFQSVRDASVTLRDRDSMRHVCAAVLDLCEGRKVWKDVQAELPEFKGQQDGD
jgi:glycyl-tRNA synthetase